VGVALAFAFSRGLPLPSPERHAYLVPTALATVWTGLLLVVSRKKAVNQVLGFLMLENGVFVFGLLLAEFMPVMVEAGVLLDLFAAVFVMGIVMFHINREFSSLDTEKLTALKD
jgi:hydrogenase-4 component E